MPQGDKSSYTDKQKRKAEHIEQGYEDRGVPKKQAQARAWATVNKESGGGNKSGSGRGKPDTHALLRPRRPRPQEGLARSPLRRSAQGLGHPPQKRQRLSISINPLPRAGEGWVRVFFFLRFARRAAPGPSPRPSPASGRGRIARPSPRSPARSRRRARSAASHGRCGSGRGASLPHAAGSHPPARRRA